MRRFIMALAMLATPISMRVGWPPQKAFAAATLDITYKCKTVNENSGLILGISSPSLMTCSTALHWSDNGTADHLWQFIRSVLAVDITRSYNP